MGRRFADRIARQHPDLTGTSGRASAAAAPAPSLSPARVAVLAVLTLDGIIVAVLGALYLPLRLGGVPFPVSALAAGLVNALLVWAAALWTESPRIAALPLIAWLFTIAALTLGGPGGDVVFIGSGAMAYTLVLYIVVGVAPAAWLLWRRNRVP